MQGQLLKIYFFLVFLTLVLSACSSNSNSFPNTKEGVKQIAEALKNAEDNSLIEGFKPTPEDCQAIMKDMSDAGKLCDYSQKFYKEILEEDGKSIRTGGPQRTDILVSRFTVGDESKSDQEEITGGYEKNLDRFRKGVTVYYFSYVEPGKTRGMRYDGLTYVNDKWIFIPKMWRALE